MLSLVLDEDRTSRTAIEKRIRTLGYTPHPLQGGTADGARAPARRPDGDDQGWRRTRKGASLLGPGALLGLAFVFATFVPAVAAWAYTAAALLGLLPILRRATAGV